MSLYRGPGSDYSGWQMNENQLTVALSLTIFPTQQLAEALLCKASALIP